MKLAQLFENEGDALIINIIRDALAAKKNVYAEGLFHNIWLKGGKVWVAGPIEREIARDAFATKTGDKTYVSFVVDSRGDAGRRTIDLPTDTADAEYELEYGDGGTLYVYPVGTPRQ